MSKSSESFFRVIFIATTTSSAFLYTIIFYICYRFCLPILWKRSSIFGFLTREIPRVALRLSPSLLSAENVEGNIGDKTQHLYVVSPTNLQLFIESTELSLSRWRSFGGWFATMEELWWIASWSDGSVSPECRDFTIAINLNYLTFTHQYDIRRIVDNKERREEGALVDSLPRRAYNHKHSVWGGWRAKGFKQPGGLDFAATPSNIISRIAWAFLRIFDRYGYILTRPWGCWWTE
jgi:hypothetical protein